MLRAVEPFIPRRRASARSTRRSLSSTERLNGEDGLGAIFPAMANAVMMFDALGYAARPSGLRARAQARSTSCSSSSADEAYCQPCVSPVWDTALACHALLEAGDAQAPATVRAASTGCDDRAGARRGRRLGRAAPGRAAGRLGLPIRQRALSRSRRHGGRGDGHGRASHRVDAAERYRAGDRRARREWVVGLQSSNGGWGAFDADNTHDYLNHIPFADHGALLDPPTADVTARCVGMLAQLGDRRGHAERWHAALDFLRASRRPTAAGTAAGA